MNSSVAVQAPRAALNVTIAGGRADRPAATFRRRPAPRATQPGRMLSDRVKVCHRTCGERIRISKAHRGRLEQEEEGLGVEKGGKGDLWEDCQPNNTEHALPEVPNCVHAL